MADAAGRAILACLANMACSRILSMLLLMWLMSSCNEIKAVHLSFFVVLSRHHRFNEDRRLKVT